MARLCAKMVATQEPALRRKKGHFSRAKEMREKGGGLVES
jgi:hypothetical protein